MSKPYIQQEVKKIFNSKEFPQSAALSAAWIVAHFKGVNIKIYDTKDKSSLCDYNLIASAENTTQARAMVDEITYCLKQNDMELTSVEGLDDAEWILVDLGDIIVHIFQETAREVFDLDQLWGECPQVEIPQEYYFGSSEVVKEKKDHSENYF